RRGPGRGGAREDRLRHAVRRHREGILRRQRPGAGRRARQRQQGRARRRARCRRLRRSAAGIPAPGSAAFVHAPLPRDRPQSRGLSPVCGGQGRSARKDRRRPLRQALRRVHPEAPPRRIHQDLRTGARVGDHGREETLLGRGGVLARTALPPSFSFDAVVRSHGWYDLPPFAYEREAGVLRTRVDSRGKAAGIRFEIRNGKLEARSSGLDLRALRAVTRRVFSLDLDFARAHESLAAAPELARALDRRGARMLRAPSLFEDAVKMLFTTNCSWAATRGMVVRLIALAGAGGQAFPTPDAVAKIPTATIARRVRCGYRAGALRVFAKRVATGKLDLASWEDP